MIKVLLRKMIGYGLNGIEVYYQLFAKDEILFLEKLATDNNLIKGIGTDFHRFIYGKNSPYKPQRFDFCVEGINPNTVIFRMLELNKWYQKEQPGGGSDD